MRRIITTMYLKIAKKRIYYISKKPLTCRTMALELYLQIGLVLFLILLVGLAYLGWKQTTDIADFAIAGEQLGPYMLGAAFAATFVGYVAWAHDFGYSFLWLYLSLISASPIALIVFAKRVRRMNDSAGITSHRWCSSSFSSRCT